MRSTLDGVEFSEAKLDDVAFHRSTIDGIKGAEVLRNITIGTDQIVPFAFPIFAALGIAIDDDYVDGRRTTCDNLSP